MDLEIKQNKERNKICKLAVIYQIINGKESYEYFISIYLSIKYWQ